MTRIACKSTFKTSHIMANVTFFILDMILVLEEGRVACRKAFCRSSTPLPDPISDFRALFNHMPPWLKICKGCKPYLTWSVFDEVPYLSYATNYVLLFSFTRLQRHQYNMRDNLQAPQVKRSQINEMHKTWVTKKSRQCQLSKLNI